MEVLSRHLDDSNGGHSEFRIRRDNKIQYILVNPGTFPLDVLNNRAKFISSLPPLPSGNWTKATISRSPNVGHSPLTSSEEFIVDLSYATLASVELRWHVQSMDIQTLKLIRTFAPRVHEVQYPESKTTAVAKVARFEFEIPWVENENAIYAAIDGKDIGPAFLSHLTEDGRLMGFLLKKIEGRSATIDDLEPCQYIVKKLHSYGILHGDLNKYNFVISTEGSIHLIDFENAVKDASPEALLLEYENLEEILLEDSGLGEPWSDGSDDAEADKPKIP